MENGVGVELARKKRGEESYRAFRRMQKRKFSLNIFNISILRKMLKVNRNALLLNPSLFLSVIGVRVRVEDRLRIGDLFQKILKPSDFKTKNSKINLHSPTPITNKGRGAGGRETNG